MQRMTDQVKCVYFEILYFSIKIIIPNISIDSSAISG